MRRCSRFPCFFHFIVLYVFVYINRFPFFLISLFSTFFKDFTGWEIGIVTKLEELDKTPEMYSATDGIWGLHFLEENENMYIWYSYII